MHGVPVKTLRQQAPSQSDLPANKSTARTAGLKALPVPNTVVQNCRTSPCEVLPGSEEGKINLHYFIPELVWLPSSSKTRRLQISYISMCPFPSWNHPGCSFRVQACGSLGESSNHSITFGCLEWSWCIFHISIKSQNSLGWKGLQKIVRSNLSW